MNRKLILWVLSLAALLVAACGKGGDPVDTRVAVVPDNLYPEATATSMFVSVTATYSWTLSLEYPEGMDSWATVDPTSGTGSKADVRLRFSVNESEQERQVTLVLTPANGASAKAVVRQSGKQVAPTPPQPGQEYGYGYDVAPSGLDWLELPAAVEDDGREMLIHRMDGKKYTNYQKDGTRNYTCYWDYKEHLSLWVAYPLNAQLHGKGGYDYVWGFDPIIPQSLQPDITQRSYGGRGFDGKNNWNRGHQMPRADRQTSQDAVSSTCYPTNMTPQDGTFNSGIWAGLESKVRSYAYSAYVADTLFVVTGCLFDQSSTYTESYSGFAVKVPTHYFKALLLAGHNTRDAREKDGVYYKAVGFLLPHDYTLPKTDFLKYMMSIDELEQQTGIDFFPNLIGRLGKTDADAVEAAQPSDWWK